MAQLQTTQIGGGALGSITDNGGGSFTVVGGGNDIWDTSDEFTFHYLPVSGDFDVRAKVESVELVATWSKAGIMVRESVAGDSRMAFSKVSGAGTFVGGSCGNQNGAADVSFMYRTWIPNAGSNGGQHEDRLVADPGYPGYPWIRLQRVGNIVRGYASADGVTWQSPVAQDTATWLSPVGGAPTPLAQDVLVGFAVSRHGCASQPTATAEFREVGIQPPVIVQQPANLTASAGSPATLSVEVDGAYFSVQWKKNDADIPGAKSTRYTIPVVAAGDAGSYSVVISNPWIGASVTSAAAVLTVVEPTAFLTHRWSFTTDGSDSVGGANGNLVGGASVSGAKVNMNGSQQYVDLPNGLFDTYNSITLETWATDDGSGIWARVWDFGNTTLGEDPAQSGAGYSGANYMFYTVPTGSGGIRGAYKLTSTGEQLIDIGTRPAIGVKHHIVWTQDAASQTAKLYVDGALVGRNALFSFTPAQSGPYLNNWLGRSMYQGDSYFKGSIDEFRVYDQALGEAYVKASAALGPDQLVNGGAVSIVQQPANQTVNELQPATFQVVLNGTLPYAVQWFRNGVAVPGATSPVYTFQAARADNGATYSAQISNPSGTATSANATLTVVFDITPPTLASVSADTTLRQFTLTFSEPVNATQAADAANYGLSGGATIGTATVLTPTTVLLRISDSDANLGDGAAYTLTVNDISDLAAIPNSIAANSTIIFKTPALSRGYVKREIWKTVGSGSAVSDLTNNAAYQGPPELFSYYNALEMPVNPLDAYGARVSGYLVPSMSGDYGFYMSADDQGSFYLSTDANPANLVLICHEPVWANSRAFVDSGHAADDGRGAFPGLNTSVPLFPAGVPLVAGTRYPLQAFLKEGGGGDNLAVTWKPPGGADPVNGQDPIPGANLATFVDLDATANIKYELWNDISGTAVAKLVYDSRYPGHPTETWYARNAGMDSRYLLHFDDRSNYGGRISGWFVPQVSGDHIFYIKSDDASQLWLSTDDNPANRVLLTEETGCCTGFSAHTSPTKTLVAGQRYYMEAIWKEGGGGDFVQVAFKLASDSTAPDSLSPIPASYFAPFKPFADLPVISITQAPQNVSTFVNRQATFTVKATNDKNVPLTFQWQKNGQDIPGAVQATYSTPPVQAADNGALFGCVVGVVGNNVVSATATLTVGEEHTPILLSAVSGPRNSLLLTFDEMMDADTATDTANYTFSGPSAPTVLDVALLPDGYRVMLHTDPLVPGGLYSITASYLNDVYGQTVQSPEDTVSFVALASLDGVVLRQIFTGLSGANIMSTLTNNAKFPADPDSTDLLTTLISPQSNPDIGNYGARMRAYLIPSETGWYSFEHHSDDSGIAYISLDGIPAHKEELVAQVDNTCCEYIPSRSVYLTAGFWYYIECLFQEGGGGDYQELRWKTPSNAASFTDIPSANLAAAFDPARITVTQQPADVTVLQNRSTTFSVAVANPDVIPLTYQWQRAEPSDPGNFADIAGATGLTYTTPLIAIGDAGVQYRVRIIEGGLVAIESAAATVSVTPDDVVPTVVSIAGSPALNRITVRFSEAVDASTATDSANYTIDGGLSIDSVTLNADGQSVTLRTSPQIPGTAYTVTVSFVTDLAGNPVADGTTLSFSGWVFTPGLVKRDFWYDLTGANNFSELLGRPDYPNSPSFTDYFPQVAVNPALGDSGREHYAARVTGVLIPSETGDYMFQGYADDSARLSISPSIDPAGLVQVLNGEGDCGACTPVNGGPVSLVAGQQYFIEALFEEGTGGDYLVIRWAPPSAPSAYVSIPTANIGVYADPLVANLTTTQQPQDQLFLISPPTTDGSGGAGGQPLITEDFNSGNGGFTVDTPVAFDGPWAYDAARGSWHEDGQSAEDQHANTSKLNSPAFPVTLSGNVRLTFVHRWSFEYDGTAWDGGQVRVSINGGPFTAVLPVAFTQGGYNGSVYGNSVSELHGQPAFISQSADYATGFVTTIANLGFLNAGDTISVQFMAASDTNTRGAVPNWEVDSVALSQGALSALTTFTAAATGTLNGQATTVYYQWQKNTGAGFVDIPGAQGTSYTLAPILADNGTKFRVIVDIPGNRQYSAEATLTVVQLNTPPSFTKGPDQSAECSVGAATVPGWATDIKPHSIPQLSGSFSSDFASGPRTPVPQTFSTDFSGGLPAGTVSSGTTSPYVGSEGALHLTDQVNSQVNFWNVPVANTTAVALNAHWKTLLAGNVGGAADGFSFNVGQDLGTGFAPEDGAANGLSVTVDTYDNGGGEVGCEIRWNGTPIAFTQVGGGGTAPADFMKNQFVNASVDVTSSGAVTFTYDSFVTTAQIPDFVGIPFNQYLFASRTGGANENCWIDDLSITATVLQGAPAPAGSAVNGNAYIADGALHLTDAANGQSGAIVVNDLLGGALLGSFNLTFNALVGNGTTPPADGFSVSVASDLPSAGWGEDGAGSGLTISFDSYDNGGGEAPAIDVLWHGVTIAHTLVASIETGGQFVPVSIKLDPDGTLDVTAAGTPVYTDLATGYVPILGAKLGIGGRTGGLNEANWIDDLSITVYPVDASTAEANQTVQFLVSTDNPGLFSAQPAITADGTLSYTRAAGMVGVAHVTVVAKDDGGTAYGGRDTSAPQTFTIIVFDHTPPTLTCVDVTVECGGPLVVPPPVAADACEGTDFIVMLISSNSTVLPNGMRQITESWTAVDNSFNFAPPCTRTITEVDTVPPQVTCPADITAPATSASGAVVTYTATASDGCGLATFACTPPSGSTFPMGTTPVVCEATDVAGLTARCTFNVTVRPANEPPVCDTKFPCSWAEGGSFYTIALDNTTACVVLDGSGTTDPDVGDTLTFTWIIDGTNQVSGSVVTNCLSTGYHSVVLVVSDGLAESRCERTLCVITAGEAVEQTIALVESTNVARKNKRPLIASLKAAEASFDRESLESGMNQLRAFQNKVRAQIAKANPAEAAAFIASVQRVLDGIACASE